MKQTIFILTVQLMAGAAMGQDNHHAPTPAQCKADAAVWSEQTDSPTGNALSFLEISKRKCEMSECYNFFYSDPAERQKVYSLEVDYVLILRARVDNFLERHNLVRQFKEEGGEDRYNFLKQHNLVQQFIKEDEAGAR